MPNRRERIINNEIYHIVHKRGGDGLMFKDIDDYYRGIFSIYEFNTSKPVIIRERRKARNKIKKIKGRTFDFDSRVEPLVEVLAFCLMPNHIHLVLRQLKDGGISKFMAKFGTGYSTYFYEKYKLRGKGYFFQGRFKSIHIENNEQFRIVFVYVHTNPIAILKSGWKEKGISNSDKVIKFLENYKWSSYADFIGGKNFPSLIATSKEDILNIMGGQDGCKEFIRNWVEYKGEIRGQRENQGFNNFQDFYLE